MPQTVETKWLLPFATGADALIEVFPFGPSRTNNVPTFSNSLGVALPAGIAAQACVDGDVRCIKYSDGRFSVFILPSLATTEQIGSLISKQCALVYRWFDETTIKAFYDALNKTALDAFQKQKQQKAPVARPLDQAPILQVQSTTPRDPFTPQDDFLNNGHALPIFKEHAIGAPLPKSAVDPRIPSSWSALDSLLEFEAVYLPPLFLADGTIANLYFPETMSTIISTLRDLLSPFSTTRRLDPARFYDRAGLLTGPLANLSRRVLVEARDEYDEPYKSLRDLSLSKVNEELDILTLPAANGIIVLPDLAKDGGPYITISRPGYEFSLLPNSRFPYPQLEISQSAPCHLQFQTICLNPPDGWFVPNDPLESFTTANTIRPIRDAVRYSKSSESEGFFNSFYSELQTLSSDDAVLLANWYLDLDLPLLPLIDRSVTLQNQFRWLAQLNGVRLRLLLFMPRDEEIPNLPTGPNRERNQNAADMLNAIPLSDIAAILDVPPFNLALINYLTNIILFLPPPFNAMSIPVHPSVTGYHQKFAVIIKNGQRAIGFAGGMDFNQNRLDSPLHSALAAYHDVHCRIEGPAVEELYKTFKQRWEDAARTSLLPAKSLLLPGFSTIPSDPPTLLDVTDTPADLSANDEMDHSTTPPQTHLDPTHNVQIARTYSNLFTPINGGSTTILKAFINAIRRAQHFIYIEDQYLYPFAGPNETSEDTVGILDALLTALTRIKYLIIVIPHHMANEDGLYRRALFLSLLLKYGKDVANNTNKVRIYYPIRSQDKDFRLSQTSGEGNNASSGVTYPGEEYIHSKIWIVDDICAKIGSANCNRRSYTNDHELDVIVVDSAIRDGCRKFARDLRVELWAEHLDIVRGFHAALYPNLYDYRIAIAMMEEFATTGFGRLRAYDPEDPTVQGSPGYPELGQRWWDHIVDPDGRETN